jgi:hypothetical protein
MLVLLLPPLPLLPLLLHTQCEGVLPALTIIEMPLVRVLMSMESQGVCLSQDALRQQRPALERRLQQLEAQAAAAVGGRCFNLAAPAEVGRVSVWVWVGWWGAGGGVCSSLRHRCRLLLAAGAST